MSDLRFGDAPPVAITIDSRRSQAGLRLDVRLLFNGKVDRRFDFARADKFEVAIQHTNTLTGVAGLSILLFFVPTFFVFAAGLSRKRGHAFS